MGQIFDDGREHHAKWKTGLFADEPKIGKEVDNISTNYMSLYRTAVN